MAVGTHWEWRAFGNAPLEPLLHVIEKLEKHFGRDDTGNRHTDEYLWTPESNVNVKLREDQLKFKRLLDESDDGCELWTEEEDESFPFPLGGAALDFIRTHMKVELPEKSESAYASLEGFKEALSAFDPPVRVVPVEKHRIQYDFPVGGSTLIIELAQILRPESTWSIGIEGQNLVSGREGTIDPASSSASVARIAESRQKLNLPGAMKVSGYLGMLGTWCSQA